MALQADGYNADTEEISIGNSVDSDSDIESGIEKDPEAATVVLQHLDLNGGPPFSARDYISCSEFSLSASSPSSEEDGSDVDYGKPAKKKKPKRRLTRRIPCDECRRMFPSMHTLNAHKHIHLGTFTCEECGKRCLNAWSLKLHFRMHGDEKPHACDQCEQAFAFRLQLVHHKSKVHEPGVMPYACEECDKAFALKTHLTSHMRVHLEKTRECDFCGAGFADLWVLKRHIFRVHSAQKKDDKQTDARRSGRNVRIDYNDDIINVEQSKEYKKKKLPSKAVDRVVKLGNRLRRRDADEKPVNKSGKRAKSSKSMGRVSYTSSGVKPSRMSGRKTAVRKYADSDSEESSDEEEGEEEVEEKVVTKSKPKNRARAKHHTSRAEDADDDKEEDDEEDEKEEMSTSRRGRSEEEEEEEEGEKVVTKSKPKNRARAKHHKSRAEDEDDDEEEDDEEDEKEEMSTSRRGRSTVRGRGKSLREKVVDQEEPIVQIAARRRGRNIAAVSPAAENSDSEQEDGGEENDTTVSTPRRGGRKTAPSSKAQDRTPTSKATTRSSMSPTKSVSYQVTSRADDNDEEEDEEATPVRSGRGSLASRRSRTVAETEVRDEEDAPSAVIGRAKARTAGKTTALSLDGRGDTTPAPSTPQRGRRASAQSPRYTYDNSDSGVDDSEALVPRRAASRRGQANDQSDDSTDAVAVAGRGKRAKKNDESNIPPKKRLRGRQ